MKEQFLQSTVRADFTTLAPRINIVAHFDFYIFLLTFCLRYDIIWFIQKFFNAGNIDEITGQDYKAFVFMR